MDFRTEALAQPSLWPRHPGLGQGSSPVGMPAWIAGRARNHRALARTGEGRLRAAVAGAGAASEPGQGLLLVGRDHRAFEIRQPEEVVLFAAAAANAGVGRF